MKIWVDDIRPAPNGYIWCKSANETLTLIIGLWKNTSIHLGPCEVYLDIDHDAGDFYKDGGDYINILSTIEEYNMREETWIVPTIHIHSMNPVGVENMRRIIKKNGWREV